MKIQVIDELDKNFDLSFETEISREHEEIFKEAENVYKFLKKIISRREITDVDDLRIAAILALYGKFLLVFKQMIVTLKLGFDVGAIGLFRVLIEQALSLKYVYYFPDQANKFFIKDFFVCLDVLEMEDKYPGCFPVNGIEIYCHQIEVIKRIYALLKKDLPIGNNIIEFKNNPEFITLRKQYKKHWAGDWAAISKKLDEKEPSENIAHSYYFLYNSYYRSASTVEHPTIFMYAKLFDRTDDFYINLVPRVGWIDPTLFGSYLYVKKIFRPINEMTDRDNSLEFGKVINKAIRSINKNVLRVAENTK